MSTSSTMLPDPAAVGVRAAEILAAIEADEAYERLRESSGKYVDCWATFTGYPVVARWNLEADKAALFGEAMKALALKAAVFALTGDEVAAELLLSLPVDEMTHAVLAQHNVVTALQARIGVLLPHMTDLEEFGWEPGDYTAQCYQAAGWGVMNDRYWIGTAEAKRRLAALDQKYASAGIHDLGRRHDFTFTPAVPGELVAA
ncbi:hypothetical protein [Hamadaea tsunoensis]|uniref:hypothetical protein n=1 Tax=Hamadaea tsunoensis TaxID=53368 RepID=UPI000404834A|nr:hypothetical protein [Hamadaea tsunoensis]